MWVFLGLVTLVGSIVLMHRQRIEDRWVGQRWGRLHIEQRSNPKTGTVIRLLTRIDIDPSLDFELKREGWIDRLAKFLKLSDEMQVGRSSFDRLCYVMTDDAAVRARLGADPAMIERLRDLVEIAGDYRFHRLVCRNGRLRVDFKPVRGNPAMLPFVSRVETHLQGLADHAPASATRQRMRDPYFARSILLLATSGGLAISGVLQVFRMMAFKLPFTVDAGEVFVFAIVGAALLVLALVVLALFLLGGTSRAHLVLMELLLVGSFGAIATVGVEVRDFNIEADRSVAQLLHSTVVDKQVKRGRRGSRRYYVVLTDWNGGGRNRRVHVSVSLYDRMAVGKGVEVSQHAGALGARWVDAIRPTR